MMVSHDKYIGHATVLQFLSADALIKLAKDSYEKIRDCQVSVGDLTIGPP